jgi:UDP-GlcNAc:undecaprenyl-phosphate GlcNAc-1-phosphate transferase
MLSIAAILFLAALVASFIGTFFAKRFATRLGLMDAPGHRKVHTVATPRNGGIGIFWGIALPVTAVIIGAAIVPAPPMPARYAEVSAGRVHDPYVSVMGVSLPPEVVKHIRGAKHHIGLLVLLIATTAGIHIVGLLDDRKPMRAWPKLLLQFAAAIALVAVGESMERGAFRTLTLLDTAFPGGVFVSGFISVCWIVALTNAFNFLDNMDGLSAGVAFICALMFLIAASLAQQWFICGLLVVFMGSCLGFLCFNFPPASIFMGDGGSMVLGFFLSALTIRTNYYGVAGAASWYTLLMPLIILAVPLYDLVIVSALRIAAGKSPMTGDTNHFSHRLTRHGFSKRGAVLVIYAVTLATGLSAPLLVLVSGGIGQTLIVLQTLAMLVVIGILERVGAHTHFSPPPPPDKKP